MIAYFVNSLTEINRCKSEGDPSADTQRTCLDTHGVRYAEFGFPLIVARSERKWAVRNKLADRQCALHLDGGEKL